MVDAFGAIATLGTRNWRGRWARARSERWLGAIVERIRTRTFTAPPNTALHTWAWHRDADGALMLQGFADDGSTDNIETEVRWMARLYPY